LYVLPYGQMSLWGLFFEPKMQKIVYYLITFSFLVLITPFVNTISKVIRLKGIYRIGPHNKDVLSIIFGSLLGDAHAEKREKGTGTRISFYQEGSHIKYILFLHNLLSKLGYCNPKIPTIRTRLGRGKIRKIARFSTWTYTSFNWIHDLWYKKNIKCIPECIGEYLTPLALAIWIMDDGAKVGSGLKFATNSYTHNDCKILVKVLKDNFNLKASIQSAGAKDQYIIYIWKESMEDLRNIVSPYIIPEMKYKLL